MTTHDEIMAMDEDALNRTVATVLLKMKNYPAEWAAHIVPNYSRKITLAYALEARIPEGVSRSAYANILFDIVNPRGSGIIWQLIHASPADRCRAWLMTMEGR